MDSTVQEGEKQYANIVLVAEQEEEFVGKRCGGGEGSAHNAIIMR